MELFLVCRLNNVGEWLSGQIKKVPYETFKSSISRFIEFVVIV